MALNFGSKLTLSTVVAAVLVGVFVFLNTQKGSPQTATSTPQGVASSTTPTLVTPDYTQPISFSKNLSPDIQMQLSQQLISIQTEIKTNPLNMRAWLNLGSVYKMGGDYEHAIMAWEFIIEVSPSVYAAYSNLGDVYMNAIKDYPKAEENYKKVIELNPKVIDSYQTLFYLYRDLYKTNTSAAKDILELGLRNNPNNATLKELLEEYNKPHVQ